MKKIVAIGEALIDMAPGQTGCPIREVTSFLPHVGGAPANVCGAFVTLGGQAQMLTKLGEDPFGDKIMEEFKKYGIGTDYICRTSQANTSLAFVALQENGDREFSFYRKPGADMLYEADEVPAEVFTDACALHFCSVSLGNYPMKQAHHRAISYAKEQQMMISFDPNLRPQLWSSTEDLKEAVQEFLKQADILKLSDVEVEFVTGHQDIQEALPELFERGIQLVLLTEGEKGAWCFTKHVTAHVDGIKVQAVDTTGAGDGFIGAFLYQLASQGIERDQLEGLSVQQLEQYLEFANQFCAKSVMKQGAIPSYEKIERS